MTDQNQTAAEILRGAPVLRRQILIEQFRLNERDIRVLDCLARFLEDKHIADELGLSVAAIKKALRHAFGKLQVRTRAEAIMIWGKTRATL